MTAVQISTLAAHGSFQYWYQPDFDAHTSSIPFSYNAYKQWTQNSQNANINVPSLKDATTISASYRKCFVLQVA